jgi:hypothetical protein
LPPEIRNKIYAYVLGGHRFHLRITSRGHHLSNANPNIKSTETRQQILAEARMLPFAVNFFLLQLSARPRRMVQRCHGTRAVKTADLPDPWVLQAIHTATKDMLAQMRAVTVLSVNLGKCLSKLTKTKSPRFIDFTNLSRVELPLHGGAMLEKLL